MTLLFLNGYFKGQKTVNQDTRRMIPYYISSGVNAADVLSKILSDNTYSKTGILVDENTREHCLPKILPAISNPVIIEISSGERHKNLDTCQKIWESMTEEGFDRKSVLINLGGGVIGDMGGFCASCFKRGIDFINVPTTLLAQVDASIGGKQGVDFGPFKNHIGLFRTPEKVIVDSAFLETLPDRELRSGFAEVIKHGLISDKAFFNQISQADFNDINWQAVIDKSIGIKASIVDSDPFENGERKLLNFGHTIGHAVEGYFLKNGLDILHGEAVALGMICEAYLSVQQGKLGENEYEQISGYIKSIFGKVDLAAVDRNEVQNLLSQDKKNVGNRLLFTLLEETGRATYDIELQDGDAIKSLANYENL